ncbi:MAG: hypothetical protein ABFC98_02400 [Candidatus Cloacimonas sp.]
MRIAKVLLIIGGVISLLFLQTALEAKKKPKEVENKLFLDDTQLDNPEYYNQFPLLSLEAFATALLTPKTTNFKIINNNYTLARADSKIAEEMVAVALGMRQEYVKIEAEGKSLISGNLEGSEAEISETMKLKLEDLKTNKAQLSEIQKTYFLSGFIYLAGSVAREKIVLESAKMFVNEAKNAQGIAAVVYVKDLPYATNVVIGLPGLLTNQLKTISEFVTIAKTQNIDIPPDVTANLFQ